MMRSLAIVVLLAGVAAAGTITPPAGWTRDPKGPATAEVYVPSTPGVELVVTRNAARIDPPYRAAAARAALDELHGMARRAALTGSNVSETGWTENVDTAQKIVTAALAWRDPGSQIVESARLVLAADATQIVGVTGECIARDDAPAALRDPCVAALATLDPGVAPASRVELALAPAGTPPPASNAPPERPATTMSEGHTPLPPIVVPQEAPSADRRPVFVGVGIVLLAGIFWWNMRRRARLEEEDRGHDA